ncbi:hypothetical protein NLG97_g1188 [Lecanicillium saksenae]|uniref:Uncharacterized protein n=1 Tax=Lecanicillium saksenae TaxID=468837 RepID=A0ACC1R5V0_9HYPO|nr:hypothetical protein NLG97_g1188 [Lecanicillium saksenae]
MALTTQLAQSQIELKGFCLGDDPVIGERLEQIDNDETPFASADGLRFCLENVLRHKLIGPTLTSFFDRFDQFGFGLYRSFSARPGCYIFAESEPEAAAVCLVVRLINKGSTILVWEASHRHKLPSIQGENKLLLVPKAKLKELKNKEVTSITHTFEHGGFILMDPRTAMEVIEGSTVTFAFATVDVVATWRPFKLPKSPEMDMIISEFDKLNVHVNAHYYTEQI